MADDLDRLHADLRALRERLDRETLMRFRRLNPFTENLIDWKQRGRDWTGDDRSVTIYDSATVIGDVEIGPHTWVGPLTMLDGSGGLTIGHHCSIATGAQLLTHDTVRWALSGGNDDYEHAATSIGDCCFIGTLSVVVKGVIVGDRCLVASGSVVVQDVAPGTIVAGAPAREVGTVEADEAGRIRLSYENSTD